MALGVALAKITMISASIRDPILIIFPPWNGKSLEDIDRNS
jgi:hypothetical protein